MKLHGGHHPVFVAFVTAALVRLARHAVRLPQTVPICYPAAEPVLWVVPLDPAGHLRPQRRLGIPVTNIRLDHTLRQMYRRAQQR
jgi:hypothetical protein